MVACDCTGEPKAQALKCSKEEAHGTGTSLGWHKAMLESMAQSRFCMIVPGDSQSSQRLSDAFVTGVCASSDVSNRLHQHAPSASDIISSLCFVLCVLQPQLPPGVGMVPVEGRRVTITGRSSSSLQKDVLPLSLAL